MKHGSHKNILTPNYYNDSNVILKQKLMAVKLSIDLSKKHNTK